MRLVCLVPRQYDESDLSRGEHQPALLPRYQLAPCRDYAGHSDEVAVLNSRVPQRKLEGLQAFLVSPDAVRKEEVSRNHDTQGSCSISIIPFCTTDPRGSTTITKG